MAVATDTALLERERELTELDAALDGAREGRGRVVLVEGPAGAGKTTVLEAALRAAGEEGFLPLRARASGLERDFGYGVVRQLLEPPVARADPSERERLFEGVATASQALFGPTGAGAAASDGPDAFSVLHGLQWLLGNLAEERPVVLAVDDSQWADDESLRFLNFLAPRLEEMPAAVFVSARSDEPPRQELTQLIAAPETVLLRPRPLSTGATVTLCRQRLGEDVSGDFASACRRATGGNPFFLDALLREIEEGRSAGGTPEPGEVHEIGPASVAESVLLRLARRPESATRLVRAVAILGDGASVAEAAQLAGLEEDEAAEAADELAGIALLERGDGLEFAHPIVRESVHAEIGPHERAEAHARAARILADAGAPEERIAAQVACADPAGDPERVGLLRRVATESLCRGAPSAAATLLRRALVEPPPAEARGEVLLDLGSSELRLGRAEAATHLEEAIGLLEDPELIALAVRELANARGMAADYDGAVAALRTGIDMLEPIDSELALLLEAELAAKALHASAGANKEAAEMLQRHAGLPGDTPGERLVLASLANQRANASESSQQAIALIEDALAGGRLLREQCTDVTGPFYALIRSLLCTDALESAREHLKLAEDDARERGSVPATAYVLVHRAWCSLLEGQLPAAEADARTALDLLESQGIRLGTAFALATLLEALVERDGLEEAESALAESHFAREIPPGMVSNNLLEARAAIHLARGRAREAFEDMREFGRRDARFGAANRLASRWRSRAALALHAAGDAEGARRMAAEDLEGARRWGEASGTGIALRASALVADDPQGCVELLSEAVETLRPAPARLEFARALVDLGASLRRANQRAEARAKLDEGLTVADRCGATKLAARARDELRAAGGPTSDPYADGVGQLTASELRVAELAAGGLSNPEIAKTLFVTRKTVETHLGRVYRKLGVAGRGELPGVLAESGT